MSYNVSDFDTKLNEQDYRKTTPTIVQDWDVERCQKFLDERSDDQLNEPLPVYPLHSTDDMRKLVCLVVWGWGWGGTDFFHKLY